MVHVAKHMSSVFRAKIIEKKQKDVNTEKIKSQISLHVGIGKTKKEPTLEHKVIIF